MSLWAPPATPAKQPLLSHKMTSHSRRRLQLTRKRSKNAKTLTCNRTRRNLHQEHPLTVTYASIHQMTLSSPLVVIFIVGLVYTRYVPEFFYVVAIFSLELTTHPRHCFLLLRNSSFFLPSTRDFPWKVFCRFFFRCTYDDYDDGDDDILPAVFADYSFSSSFSSSFHVICYPNLLVSSYTMITCWSLC